jgi:phosphoglycerol transferase MdoB-like AlkP superfamily enzyme
MLILVMLGFFRLVFFIRSHDLWRDIPSFYLFRGFINGLWFDSVIASYILAVPVLILFFSFIPNKALRLKVAQTYISIIAPLFFFLSLIDIYYFEFFGSHLDHFSYSYLGHFQIVLPMIWEQFPLLRLLFLFTVIICLYIWLRRIVISKIEFGKKDAILLIDLIIGFLMLGFVFLGARGKYKSIPIHWGDAYFCSYQFANQLGLNGQFTLLSSLSEKKLYETYFKDEQTLSSIITRYYVDESDSALSKVNPLIRKIKVRGIIKSKPNIVFIVLESWRADMVGCLGDSFRVTPHFDRIAAKGILFDRFYAAGIRSNRGLLSILSGFPGYKGSSLMKKVSGLASFPTIIELLRPQGYRDGYFLYGGDQSFDNMKSFLRNNGFNKFTGIEAFLKEEYGSMWGASDKAMFKKAAKELTELDQPFAALIFTLTTHEPFTKPPDLVSIGDSLNTPRAFFYDLMHYTDEALGQFFKKVEKESFFQNTIFVITADHTKKFNDPLLSSERFHIPAVIYSPLLKDVPRRISTIGSQADLVPTILSMMGGDFIINSWGRDILSKKPGDAFAHFNTNAFSGLVTENEVYYLNLKTNKSLIVHLNGEPVLNIPDSLISKAQELCRLNKAVTQGSFYYYQNKLNRIEGYKGD